MAQVEGKELYFFEKRRKGIIPKERKQVIIRLMPSSQSKLKLYLSHAPLPLSYLEQSTLQISIK